MTELIAKPRPTPNTMGQFVRRDVLRGGEQITGNIWRLPLSDSVIERANVGVKRGELPEGYALAGGAARNCLEALVHPDVTIPSPRDVDLAYWGKSDGFDGRVADELARRFSPRDFAYGHGVGVIGGLAEYMNNRDFTINQVLSTGDAIYATTQAVRDMEQYRIRPTVFEHGRDYPLGDKLALKAVRLLAEYRAGGVEEADIYGIDLRRRHNDIRDFWHALILDKALELGDDVAREYLRLLGTYDMHPAPSLWRRQPLDVYKEVLRNTDFAPSAAVVEMLKGGDRERRLRAMGLMGKTAAKRG